MSQVFQPVTSWNRLDVHLVVENLGLASLSLGDKRLVQNVENILADALQFVLDLLAVVLDDGNVLLRALGFLLLLNGGDDAPGGTAGTNDVLVGNRQQVTLIDSKLASDLVIQVNKSTRRKRRRKKKEKGNGEFIYKYYI